MTSKAPHQYPEEQLQHLADGFGIASLDWTRTFLDAARHLELVWLPNEVRPNPKFEVGQMLMFATGQNVIIMDSYFAPRQQTWRYKYTQHGGEHEMQMECTEEVLEAMIEGRSVPHPFS